MTMKKNLEFYINNMANNIFYIAEVSGDNPHHIFLSEGYKTLLGWPKEKSLNDFEFFYTIVHPDDVERVRKILSKSNYNTTFTYRIRKANGEYIRAVSNNYTTETNGVTEAFGMTSLIEN